MQVILKEDILNLGYKDDVVTVKSGYGRNYLIPQGKAVIATPSALKMLAENMKQRAHKLEKIKNDAKVEKHLAWAEKIYNKYSDINGENIDKILKDEVGVTFSRVLEYAGVYKRDAEGQNGFLRFVEKVNSL